VLIFFQMVLDPKDCMKNARKCLRNNVFANYNTNTQNVFHNNTVAKTLCKNHCLHYLICHIKMETRNSCPN